MKRILIILSSVLMAFVMTGCSLDGFTAYGTADGGTVYNIDAGVFDLLEDAGVVCGAGSSGISMKAGIASTVSGLIAVDGSVVRTAVIDESAVDYRTPGIYFITLRLGADASGIASAAGLTQQGDASDTVWVSTTLRLELYDGTRASGINDMQAYEKRSEELLGMTGGSAVLLSGLAPHEHSYAETSRTDATCTDEGLVTYTCSVCGDRYSETLPATGHDFETVSTEVIEDGYTEVQAVVKNQYYDMEHDWLSCTGNDCDEIFMDPGIYHGHSSLENKFNEERGTVSGHNAYSSGGVYRLYRTVQPRTCTTQVCRNCGLTRKTVVIQAAYEDYDYDDGPVLNDYYFDKYGITPPDDGVWFYCVDCGEFFEHMDVHDHKYVCSCGYFAVGTTAYQEHLASSYSAVSHSLGLVGLDGGYTCKCGETFATVQEFKAHATALNAAVEKHTIVDDYGYHEYYNNYVWYICECGEAFATPGDWLEHARTHEFKSDTYEHDSYSVIPIYQKQYHEAVTEVTEY